MNGSDSQNVTPPDDPGLAELADRLKQAMDGVEQVMDDFAARLRLVAEGIDAEGKRGQSPFVQSTLRAVPANGDCPLFPAIPADQPPDLAQLPDLFRDVITRGDAEQIRELQQIGTKIDGVKQAIEQQKPDAAYWGE